MTLRQVVLDASALVALVRREKGWQAILSILGTGTAVTTPTGLAETLDTCRRRGAGISRTEICEFLELLGLGVEPLIAEDAVEIAFIMERAASRKKSNSFGGDLSLGDAARLSVGRRLNAIVVFSDNAWESLDLSGIEILPFR
jgi:ribonuclease VapC